MHAASPRADDLPGLDSALIERPTAANPLGVKGSGQAGCIAAPQTMMAAILDALRPAGVEALDMPATPERVWQALLGARHSSGASSHESLSRNWSWAPPVLPHPHRREIDVP